ncbi:MAG: hypothetical protein KDB16_10495 [Acidimicrobiales bacterium]|nr:hypothetical protein [Acidimicrobiales bacterium]
MDNTIDQDRHRITRFIDLPEDDLTIKPHLDAIEQQAQGADRTRVLDAQLIADIRDGEFLKMPASREIGGTEQSIVRIGRELGAVAYRCPSLAWVLWNHQAVFHLFAGALGPERADLLTQLMATKSWVSFPAGAGSGVHGRLEGDSVVLNGQGTFSTGARYGDYCGVVFAVEGPDGTPRRPLDLRFSLVANDRKGVTIDHSWDGAGLRASATDTIHYRDVEIDVANCVSWFGANRAESLRTIDVVNHRYREDWVGISDLWLGWMALNVVARAAADVTAEATTRKAIMGARMIDRPTVQINIGKALALTAAAHATIKAACTEVDDRIAGRVVPDTADYLRQQATVSMAVDQLSQAIDLLVKVKGANGMREGDPFERRVRDFRAMPLHINVHADRITHQLGRYGLGIELDAF